MFFLSGILVVTSLVSPQLQYSEIDPILFQRTYLTSNRRTKKRGHPWPWPRPTRKQNISINSFTKPYFPAFFKTHLLYVLVEAVDSIVGLLARLLERAVNGLFRLLPVALELGVDLAHARLRLRGDVIHLFARVGQADLGDLLGFLAAAGEAELSADFGGVGWGEKSSVSAWSCSLM